MKIFSLTPTQKGILFQLILDIVRVDSVVSTVETDYVDYLMTNLQDRVELKEDAYNLISQYFTTRQEKFILVTSLLTVAFLDNVLHPLEMNFISKVMNQLQLPANEVRQLLLWSQRQALQINEAASF